MARINKCIDLFEHGKPAAIAHAMELSYEAGRDPAQQSNEMIWAHFEHLPFDMKALADFMRGLKDGGPTPSGHPTPTVIAVMPFTGMSEEEVKSNKWQAKHVLAAGVHGMVLCHARDPEAVKAFVACARFPSQTAGLDMGLPEGLRGQGAQAQASKIWGVSPEEYIRRSDPWPLNPDGELLLGLKIEDRHCVANADAVAATPGISFAEWGPGDMAISYGYQYPHREPYPPDVIAARDKVKAACDYAGIAWAAEGAFHPASRDADRA